MRCTDKDGGLFVLMFVWIVGKCESGYLRAEVASKLPVGSFSAPSRQAERHTEATLAAIGTGGIGVECAFEVSVIRVVARLLTASRGVLRYVDHFLATVRCLKHEWVGVGVGVRVNTTTSTVHARGTHTHLRSQSTYFLRNDKCFIVIA